MSTNSASFPISPPGPIAWIGHQSLAAIAYLGGLAYLSSSSVAAIFRRSDSHAAEGSFVEELSWMLVMGAPLVGLVHVGVGSFLSMQSYFGGTFVEGTGAVVGVGLIRNVAPLMAGLTLAGLLSARITPELLAKRRERSPVPVERPGFLERTASGLLPPLPALSTRSLAHLSADRLWAATVAGLVMSVWGTVVGMVVGWQVGQTMVGVSTHSFFQMFWEMLWLRDVIGLAIKGLVYGFFAGLFACQEGMRASPSDGFEMVASASCRAACFAIVAILIVNSGWFILVYHAGPAFGPTVLAPPTL